MIYAAPLELKANIIEEQYPLSSIQQGMLFHSLYAPQSGVNIEQFVCGLHEDLKVSFFKQAWNRIVERHPLLRTSFCWQGVKEPLQQVHRQVAIPFEEQDWRGLSAIQQEDKLKSYLQFDRQRGFQLTEAPLMRLALFRVAEADYQCVWTFHHVLLDGRSFPIIFQELFAVYEAFCQGEDLQLEQPRPYRDYINWLGKQDFALAENFWRSTLSGFTAPTPLTVDRVHHLKFCEVDSGYGLQEIRLSETVTSGLQSLAQQHQLTFNTLVQGAWALLLSRYSGEEDVVFGATRACRRSAVEGAESMVGLFINTLPVRVRMSSEMPLIPWLKELRTQWIALRDYEHTPLVEIQGWSDIPTGQQLFESILVFENYQLNSTLQAQGGNWENREFRLLERTNYPLTVAGYLEPSFLLKIGYERCRFDDATITRMLGHLKTLLEGMVANPEQRLMDLPLLTAAERHQLLVEWNNTQADYPHDACIHQLFEAQVERTPDAIAVVFQDKQLTYRELNTRANQLAHYLRSLGVKPDTLVAISVERSLEMVVGFLGILKAGGAYVPVDPAYPHDRRAYQIQDSQTPIILTLERLVASLPEYSAQVVRLDTDWDVIAQHSQENPVNETTTQNLAYAIYTSGSTGKPKGAMLTHQGMVNQNVAIAKLLSQKECDRADRVLQFSSISFDIIVAEMFPALICGAAVILRSEEMLSTADFLQFIEQERVSVVHLPTAFWHELVNGLSLVKKPLPASLRLVFVGGEKISRTAYLTWLQRVGKYPRLLNAYGPTETTVTATLYDLAAISEDDQALSEIPIGRPIANDQVYILDQQLQPVPIGVPGELHIGGTGVGRGYLNRPELTASKFIRNPFSDEPDARLYKTGDTGRYLPDGNIEYVGRIDYQVKIRGFRIELGEIEAVLEQHPVVQQTVILAREDVPGKKRLVAYLVLNQQQRPDNRELRSFLKERLPDYMVPSVFVTLDVLPMTPNGKVDRRALPTPNLTGIESEGTVMAPRDPVELQLTKIWEEVLGIGSIGITDNLFDLGGHSLLIMRLVAQINQVFGTNLPVISLYQAPTIEQLANLLRQEESSTPWRSLVPIQTEGDKLPLFCIHEIAGSVLFCQGLTRYLPNQPIYGLQPLGLDGKQAPQQRVEDMAAHFIQEIQTVQPNGPYYLGGFSFGGLVCLEMAQQLEAQGQKVALLALFDSRVSGYLKPLKPMDWLLYQVKQVLQRGPNYFLARLKAKAKPKTEQIQDKVSGAMSMYAETLNLDRESSIDQNILSVMEACVKAEEDYVPQVYSGQVNLFRATLEPAPGGGYLDPQLGWGKIAVNGVEIHKVPSIHPDMFKEPQVQILAEQLKDCLDRAQAQT
jgi:amino acid adenylation domain-containing protein